ncbi:MAG: hypothetical protein C4520_12470 [Candidatus Abyssobacteria bacterium SURF_5]|uniref:Alginate export domain-containing protein n=1 Tax=Abyssobacteria bacterium (strain SURF_5) TaxID=2093360 RepID=A0A3A4NRR7_ABYX5|nr:MAG: hypothetical protein C4520_12470 [Candidatus Abyssubacteria bacterium SURF_5]
MKKLSILLAVLLVASMTLPAAAEVEEITVGGSLQIRGQYLDPGFGFALPGGLTGFDDDLDPQNWVSQRTLINVDARLTGGIRAFAELQAFDIWGVDETDADSSGYLRTDSPYATLAGQGNDEIQLYQGYIELNDLADLPLMVRVGRQELVYGREWLIGNNNDGVNFSGLSFDAAKVSYAADLFRIDAWWSQLANNENPGNAVNLAGSSESESNWDFMGVYGTFTGIENMALDGYFLWARTGEDFPGSVALPVTPTLTDDVNLYTAGARFAGCWDFPAIGLIDFNVEGAYQFGDSYEITGPAPLFTATDGDYEAWAFNAVAGYTFDEVQLAPRVEVEYAYFSGDDDPLDGDVESFTRLFSDVHYGEMNVGGNLDATMTNVHVGRIGASIVPVERLTLSGDFYYFMLADDEGDVLGLGTQVAGDEDDEVGMEIDVAADYQYTEDLNLRVGWAHFFAGDAIENIDIGGGVASDDDDDVDYVYVQALLVF